VNWASQGNRCHDGKIPSPIPLPRPLTPRRLTPNDGRGCNQLTRSENGRTKKMKARIPKNETARVEALRRYQVLDTAPEQTFDDITLLASHICGTPIAIMALVEGDRQWFKSKVGLAAVETHRNESFCAHALEQTELLVVEDALQDERFVNNPLVTSDPHIRFYAGAPLITPEGFTLGTLCVIDRKARQLTSEQATALNALARLVITKLELKKVSAELAEVARNFKTLSALLPICSYCKGIRNDEGYWHRVESYIQAHTDSEFTHSICPDCAKKHFHDLDLYGKKKS
jgi:hypothetical protein